MILANEYVDVGRHTHPVEHSILAADNHNIKEQIIEELYRVLTKPTRSLTV